MNSNNSSATDGDKTEFKTEARSHAAQSAPSYYEMLGLKPNASVQEIRRAYRDLSKLYHPDTTQLESAIAVPKFQALNEAYATLSSPEKRLSYDYKSGYSRISVMQPLRNQTPSDQRSQAAASRDWSSSAYLDPNDRPLSAGEMFALFILGVTFIGCLVLVFAIGLTHDDLGGELEGLLRSPQNGPKATNELVEPPSQSQGSLDSSALDPSTSDLSTFDSSTLDSSAPVLPKAPPI